MDSSNCKSGSTCAVGHLQLLPGLVLAPTASVVIALGAQRTRRGSFLGVREFEAPSVPVHISAVLERFCNHCAGQSGIGDCKRAELNPSRATTLRSLADWL